MVITFRLPEVFGAVFKDWCNRQGLTQSEVLREAVLGLWRAKDPGVVQVAMARRLPDHLLSKSAVPAPSDEQLPEYVFDRLPDHVLERFGELLE